MERILFVTHKFPPDIGGLASSSARIPKSLASLGFQVDILVFSRQLPAGQLSVEANEPDANPRILRVGLARQWDSSLQNALDVLDWLYEQNPYDATWGHYLFPSGFLAVWFALKHKIPSIVSARGNDIDVEMFPPGDFARLCWTIKRANFVTAVSRDIATKIERLTERADTIGLQNAVDTEVFRRQASAEVLRRELGIAPDELVLGFSGELRAKKGMNFILKSLAEVREHRPACLLVIGSVRAANQSTMQLFTAQHPADAQRVIVTGNVTDQSAIARYLSCCDIVLQPSLLEGMPNALLEAMSCERVCIASDAGGIPEILQDGQNGFIVRKAQLNFLSEKILQVADMSPQLREAISVEARRTVLEHFTSEMEARQLKRVMDRLLKLLV